MEQTVARASAPSPVVFRDGFGDRRRIADPTSTDKLEVLCLRSDLTAVPSFEMALRERVARLSAFQHPSFGRARTVRQLNDARRTVALGSDATPGIRLSDLLANAERHQLPVDMDATWALVRQLVPAMAALHEQGRDVAHGALGPERIVLTPDARVVVVEHVMGSALEQLKFSHDRFWKELRIPCRPSAGSPALDHRTDVMQIGVVALALMLGRPLHDNETPSTLGDLVGAAWDGPGVRDVDSVSAFRSWLSRALQLNLRDAFLSVAEAMRELDAVLSHAKTLAQPAAIEGFIARHQRTVDEPAPVAAPKPPLPFPTVVPSVSSAPAAEEEVASAPAEAEMAQTEDMQHTEPATETVAEITPVVVESVESPTPVEVLPEPVMVASAPVPLPVDLAVLPFVAKESPATMHKFEAEPEVVSAHQEPLPAAVIVSHEPERVEQHDFEMPLVAAGGNKTMKRGLIAAGVVLVCAAAGIPAMRGYFSPAPTIPPEGILTITSNPAGAKLAIDGETRGVTPLTLTVPAGPHTLSLKATGDPRTISVNVAPGSQVSQYVELSAGKPAATGSLQIRTEPSGAQVHVDGAARGTSPVTINDLTPGEHTVVVDGPSGTAKQTVTVEAGATASLVAQLTTAPNVALPGFITVSAPSEVQLFENGRLLGSSQTDRLMVPAGSHQLEIVNQTLGYRVTRSVSVTSDKVSTIKLEFPNGTIALNATPWADVTIDGAKVGQTPIGNLPVTIGTHEVIFRHPELGEKRQSATVTLTAPTRLSIDMRQK